MMNRPGYRRDWPNGRVAHKGYFDRHGRHVVMPLATEERIIAACGGCLKSLYALPLRRLTEFMLAGREE